MKKKLLGVYFPNHSQNIRQVDNYVSQLLQISSQILLSKPL